MDSRVDISVVICCHNSSSRLLETLSHLAAQEVSSSVWEVIVVDNDSTDDTLNVAESTWKQLGEPVRMKAVKEPRPGLSNARVKGVESSSGDLIIFCDDDNWLTRNYVESVCHFLHNNPAYAAIGGRVEARTEPGVIVPDWFEKVSNLYAVGAQAAESGDVTKRGYVWGAGMAFRKQLFLKAVSDEFPLCMADRTGVNLSSGGDGELCLRWINMGYRLFYSTELLLYHFIPSARLTLVYLEGLKKGIGGSSFLLNLIYAPENNTIVRLEFLRIKWTLRYYLYTFGLIGMPDFAWKVVSVCTTIQHVSVNQELRHSANQSRIFIKAYKRNFV